MLHKHSNMVAEPGEQARVTDVESPVTQRFEERAYEMATLTG